VIRRITWQLPARGVVPGIEFRRNLRKGGDEPGVVIGIRPTQAGLDES
jgi:hypothetical protein